MRPDERDSAQLALIVRYCDKLLGIMDRVGGKREVYLADDLYQDSCALCFIQIGEAVHRLSEEFKAAHPEIEWTQIYGLRNYLVRAYEGIDSLTVWETMQEDVQPLRTFCADRAQGSR